MKTFILILLLFAFTTSTKAQNQKLVIEYFTNASVLIEYSVGVSSTGTIVSDSTNMYLITARHCLYNELKPNAFTIASPYINIISYKDNSGVAIKDGLQLDLNVLEKGGFISYSPNVDIAIVRLANVTPNGTDKDGFINIDVKYLTGVQKLTNENPKGIFIDVLLDLNNVDIGDDSFMFGYPKSLKTSWNNDYDFDRPLLRKGIIAGIDKKFHTIIVDCPSYQGNSGGPVFEFSLTGPKAKVGLIGIVSRSIVLVEEWKNQYYGTTNSDITNSGYAVIIPIEFAKKLIKQMK